MTNLEIDRKLAEAMGYEIDTHTLGELRVFKNASNKVARYFRPTESMSDAWEVAERFCFDDISRNAVEGTWTAVFNTDSGLVVKTEQTAPLAICKAALKVIEHGS